MAILHQTSTTPPSLEFLVGGLLGSLFATSIQNDRKMRPIHSVLQNIRFYCRNPGEEKDLNFHDGPLSFHLTSAGRSAQCGQIGRHCLAGISKGHRGNSNFFLPLAPYTYHGPLSTGIREDAFFQYLIQIQARVNRRSKSEIQILNKVYSPTKA